MAIDFVLDEGAGGRAKLGLIILQTDETIENEFRELVSGEGISLLHARLPSAQDVTAETLAQMENDLPLAASLFPPKADLDVIGYACTSGSTIIGEARVAELVERENPGVKVTNPMTAVKVACTALRVKRLGFLSPYVDEVSASMRTNLEDAGFTICELASYEQEDEKTVTRIAQTSTYQAIVKIGQNPACDAVFVSCTNLRTLGILASAEQALGKPVVSSNQALAWHMLRLAGIEDPNTSAGQLFDLSLPEPV